MAVKFNVVERGNPSDPEAPKKFYASAIMNGKADIEELIGRIEKISTVSGADIRGVLYSIIDIVPDILSQGRSVRIGDLGTFRVSISSEGSETEEEVSAKNVRSARIIFTPGKKFKTMLSGLSYSKA